MRDARIGRVLAASLHQAIVDILPARLEFYENWLSSAGLRKGTIGLAPITAVLSFLRREGDAYALVVACAGEYAAEWSVDALPSMKRSFVRGLPWPLRVRASLRLAAGIVRRSYVDSRALIRVRRGTATIDLRRSLFCDVRDDTGRPRCGFYAAATARLLQRFDLAADARSTGVGPRVATSVSCQLSWAMLLARITRPELTPARVCVDSQSGLGYRS